jgi:transcriptional regulator with XRE-family HTH domain
MADKLCMSQSAYSKLENEKTSLRKELIILLVNEFGKEAISLLLNNELNILKEKIPLALSRDLIQYRFDN